MHRGRVRQLAMAVAWAAALAMTLGAGEPLEAFINSRTGGPLWWMPENDENWSRFHDVWHNSADVELAAPGAATSFPEHTWAVTRIRGYATEAMPNSACDVQNGVVRNNVGPPLNNSEYPTGVRPDGARDPRSPLDGSGGLGGLQMSVHIGEWWQGLYFQQTPGSTYSWPSGWNSQQYGSFRVTTKNNDGTEILAFGPTGPWDRMTARPGMFLEGGGSGTWGCIGQALVMMHGTPNGGGVYPDTLTGADGNTCHSQARLFVLRGNTEARCEPDLSQRYELTEDFWEWFEQYRYSAGGARVPEHPVYGDSLPPLASSAESVGEFWFGQVAKCVIQSDFQCPGGAEPIRPFGDHSGLSVEAFDNATGELPPGSEPVQNQVAVRAQPCGQPPSSGRAASASSGCTSGRGTGRPSTATRSPTAIESPP